LSVFKRFAKNSAYETALIAQDPHYVRQGNG